MNVIDAIRSPARERRDVCVATVSPSSRSGLPPKIAGLSSLRLVTTHINAVTAMPHARATAPLLDLFG